MRKIRIQFVWGLWIFIITILLSIIQTVSAQNANEIIRAIWVARWDYQSSDDIKQIVNNSANCNFNIILFQVRGNGTVHYSSKLETRAKQGGSIPDWDPLAEAIKETRRNGLQLHAWINVYPGWRGIKPPEDKTQLFNKHPEWFMVDEDQKPMALNPKYVWLNPILSDVQDYLAEIVYELAEVPDLDGIHFDYFRFPGPGFSYDNVSLQIFYQKYHTNPGDSYELWNKFRRDVITDWLDKVYKRVKQNNPNFIISSAVSGDYDLGTNLYFQDSHLWLARGIIDIIFPMVYTEDTRTLELWLKGHESDQYGKYIWPGLQINNDFLILQDQIALVRQFGFAGVSLFSYSSLFPDHQPNQNADFLRNKIFKQKAATFRLKN